MKSLSTWLAWAAVATQNDDGSTAKVVSPRCTCASAAAGRPASCQSAASASWQVTDAVWVMARASQVGLAANLPDVRLRCLTPPRWLGRCEAVKPLRR